MLFWLTLATGILAALMLRWLDVNICKIFVFSKNNILLQNTEEIPVLWWAFPFYCRLLLFCTASSLAQTIHDICHRYHRSYLWRKNMSCGEISDFFTSAVWRNLKLLHIHHVEKLQISPHDRCGESNLFPQDGCEAISHFSTWQI